MALIHPGMVASTLLVHSPNSSGTGFMIARPDIYDYDKPEKHDYHTGVEDGWKVWLVTCAHCITTDDMEDDIEVELNIEEHISPNKKVTDKYQRKSWTIHPDYRGQDTPQFDIAITAARTRTDFYELREAAMWPADWHLSKESMKTHGIVEGDEIYTVGFPLGLGEGYGQRNDPIVRHGIIAQCKPYLLGYENSILVDVPTWEGNSGGPVLTKPASTAIAGTNTYRKSSLLGMIQGTIAWEEENTKIRIPAGVGLVIPLQTINQAIDYRLGLYP